MTFHEQEGLVQRATPTENVINDIGGIVVLIDGEPALFSQRLPRAADVVDKCDEGRGAIYRPKRRDSIRPLDCIGALKSEFRLTGGRNSELVIPHGRVEYPEPSAATARSHDRCVTMGNWVSDDTCDLVEGDVVDAKAPNKVVYIVDMLLMRLWGQETFKQPLAIVDLPNVSNLFESGNAFPHFWFFTMAVEDFLDGNGMGRAGVDDTFIVSNGYEDCGFVEDGPIFTNERVNLVAGGLIEMREAQMFVKCVAILRLIILDVKKWIDVGEVWKRVFNFAENVTTINRVEKPIVFIRLIRKSAVVNEDIFRARHTLGFRLRCNVDWKLLWGNYVRRRRDDAHRRCIVDRNSITGRD